MKASNKDLERKIKLYEKEIKKLKQENVEAIKIKEKYNNILENIHEIYYEATLDGVLIDVGPSVEKITEFKREELIGKSLMDLYAFPEKRSAFLEILLQEGRMEDYEVELLDKDGLKRYGSVNVSLIKDSKGNPIKIVGSIRDVSARKMAESALVESEAKYRNLVERAKDGIFIIKKDKLRFVNPALAQMTNYTVEELLNKHYKILIPKEEHSIIEDNYQRRQKGEQIPTIYESKILSKDGRIIDVEYNIGVINFEGVSSNLTIVRDITERKKVEAALQNLNQSLEEMVYVTSHDLQVPLISMEGYATELLESYSDKLDKDGVHYLTRIQKNAQSMQKLVLSLLDISRLTTKKQPFEELDTNEIVNSIITDLSLTIERSKANITALKLPKIIGDKQRIDGVFRKLLTNALNYKGKNIIVGFKDKRFFVDDDGIGIPPDQLEKIFQPGERLKLINVEGVGMGLTFCIKVIRQHGGEIWAESQGPEKGSTFFFTIKTEQIST